MALCYKLKFKKEVTIEELSGLLIKINEELENYFIGIQDFNIENYWTDQALIEEGNYEDTWLKPGQKFNYLSGYLNFNKSGQLDNYFKTFKKVLLNLDKYKLKLDIEKVLIQDSQLIQEKNWVEIPS